jgi:hypothetical protein
VDAHLLEPIGQAFRAQSSAPSAPDDRAPYVLDWGGASVTPVDTRADAAAAPIQVGGSVAIAFTPDDATAYRATLVSTRTGAASAPKGVGGYPVAVAIGN